MGRIPKPDPRVRAPARAGQFYPADAGAMNAEVDRHLRTGLDTQPGVSPQRVRAVILPHAGWMFCGSVIGRTLARVAVPNTVIIIGPRHTQFGAWWSVASHERWQLPDGDVTIETSLAKRLIALDPRLTAEPEAHRVEHGSEVLLPFLRRMNPNVRALPIVLGDATWEETTKLSRAIADLLAEQREAAPLLVISSDMNHFAPDAENRRRDAMALDAMIEEGPESLYQTCRRENISMCGLIPAVAVMRALQYTTPELSPELVHYTTSAEASGDTSSVVGYAGVAIP